MSRLLLFLLNRVFPFEVFMKYEPGPGLKLSGLAKSILGPSVNDSSLSLDLLLNLLPFDCLRSSKFKSYRKLDLFP